jgi:hypothetical protein
MGQSLSWVGTMPALHWVQAHGVVSALESGLLPGDFLVPLVNCAKSSNGGAAGKQGGRHWTGELCGLLLSLPALSWALWTSWPVCLGSSRECPGLHCGTEVDVVVTVVLLVCAQEIPHGFGD